MALGVEAHPSLLVRTKLLVQEWNLIVLFSFLGAVVACCCYAATQSENDKHKKAKQKYTKLNNTP